MSRWATFDCYGTLIDWNAGIGAVLEGLYGAERAPVLLRRYHELEPEVQSESYRSYADVLSLTLERLANEAGVGIPEGEATCSRTRCRTGPRSRRRRRRWRSCAGAAGASRSSRTRTVGCSRRR